jgi:predicted RNA-binding protein YlqC (UPF0109 family)
LKPAESEAADGISAGRTGYKPVFRRPGLAALQQRRYFALVKEFLEFVIRQLVEFPDEMMLSEIPSGKTTIFRVQLRQSDVGRIIGRNGQTINAIRALLASSAARHGQRATLEIME